MYIQKQDTSGLPRGFLLFSTKNLSDWTVLLIWVYCIIETVMLC